MLVGDGPWSVGRGDDNDLAFPNDPYCSRKQAIIARDGDQYFIECLSDNTPMTVNGAPVTGRLPLDGGAEISFAGQHLTFEGEALAEAPPTSVMSTPKTSLASPPTTASPTAGAPQATESSGEIRSDVAGTTAGNSPQPASTETPGIAPAATSFVQSLDDLASEDFSGPVTVRHDMKIGRTVPSGNIQLDHPTVSREHAILKVQGDRVFLRDLGSTNGTFVNGVRATKGLLLQVGDRINIGPFSLKFDGQQISGEPRQEGVRLSGHALSKDVRDNTSGDTLRILDNVSVDIAPREFVCLLGPSGSGKSTLMNVLSGRSAPSEGRVFVNELGLHENFDALKPDIAMVEQHNVLHEGLTLEQALGYAAELRLPYDLPSDARSDIVSKAADNVELGDRLGNQIATLSGGQKKRASLSSETLNRPGLLYLDEVTSGLDEQTDWELMRLLRQMADDGMTIVCVTHTLANVEAFCHKVVVMGSPGVMTFAGTPSDALEFFKVKTLGGIFGRLREEPSATWRSRFRDWARERGIATANPPPADGPAEHHAGQKATLRRRFEEGLRQWAILSRRNLRLMLADRKNLAIAALQSVLIGVLVGYVFGSMGAGFARIGSQTALLFLLSMSALWIGCSSASKDIVGEAAIFRREYDVNLSAFAFVLSKFTVTGMLTTVQVLIVYFLTGLLADDMPGAGVMQFLILVATGLAAVGLGLLISSLANTRDQATTIVPLVLIPQLILAGGLVPTLPGGAQFLAEIAVTGYWAVEALTDMFIRIDGPISTFIPDLRRTAVMESTSVFLAFPVIILHCLVFLGAACAITASRYRRKG